MVVRIIIEIVIIVIKDYQNKIRDISWFLTAVTAIKVVISHSQNSCCPEAEKHFSLVSIVLFIICLFFYVCIRLSYVIHL